MTYLHSVEFIDGFVVVLGDLVTFSTRHGSHGQGHVRAIVQPIRGPITVRLVVVPGTILERLDAWPLADGGAYSRLASEGIYGGELVRPNKSLTPRST